MRMTSTGIWVILIFATIVLVGCGSDENGRATSVPQSTSSVGQSASPTTVATSGSIATAASPVASTGPHFTAKDAGLPSTGTPLDDAILISRYELDGLRYGGTLREAIANTTSTIDPMRNNSSPINSVGRYIYEKLIGLTPQPDSQVAQISPVLAENWKVSDDFKTYTIKLRQGIKWQNMAPVNGRELVADDFVFSIQRNLNKESVRYADYQQVASVAAPDKYTVVITLNAPNAWALNDMFTRPDYVVARELVAQESDGILKLKAVGTGPFMMKSYEFRRGGTFVRNPDYWDKDVKGNRLPYVDAVEQTYVTDPTTMVAGVRTGQFDLAVTGLNTQNVLDLAKTIPGYRIYSPGLGPSAGIAFNTKRAPWSDVKVRRALNMAVDKNKFGEITSTTGAWSYAMPLLWELVDSSRPFKSDDLGPFYKYNPQESKKLRAEAGFTDGKLKIASPLQVGGSCCLARMQVLQELWKKEGIDLDLAVVDAVVMYTAYYVKDYPDIAPTFQTFGDVSLNTYAQSKFATGASENTALIDDPEVQKVVSAIKATTDPAKLSQYARLLWDFDTLGSWNIWLPGERGYSGFPPRVRNFMGRHSDVFTSQRGQIDFWLSDAPRTSP